MLIIGCDFHSRFQVIAMLDSETGEFVSRRLEHSNGEVRKFYAELPGPALVGIESASQALVKNFVSEGMKNPPFQTETERGR